MHYIYKYQSISEATFPEEIYADFKQSNNFSEFQFVFGNIKR